MDSMNCVSSRIGFFWRTLASALVAAFLIVAFPSLVFAGTPELFIPETTHQFGRVMQGETISYDFEVRNNGDGPLTIKGVEPACGCTAAIPEKKLLEPGESTVIQAQFDTSGFQGHKVKTIRIHTDDPKRLSAVLGFEGEVLTDIQTNPPRLRFGIVKKGESIAKPVSIVVSDGSKTNILEVLSRSEHLKLQVVKGDKRRREVTVTLEKSAPIGILKSRVVVRTDSKTNPIVNIPVFARVEGDLKVVPPDMSFGLLEGPILSPKIYTLLLSNSGDTPVKVLSVGSSNDAITTEVKQQKAGTEYEIAVQLKPGTVGELRGNITIETDHPDPDQNKISVPIYGIVARKGV